MNENINFNEIEQTNETLLYKKHEKKSMKNVDESSNEVKSLKKHKQKNNEEEDHSNNDNLSSKKHKKSKKVNKDANDKVILSDKDENKSQKNGKDSNSEVILSKKHKNKSKKNDKDSNSEVILSNKHRKKSKKNDKDTKNEAVSSAKHRKKSKKKDNDSSSEDLLPKKHKKKRKKVHKDSNSEVLLTDNTASESKHDRIKRLIDEVKKDLNSFKNLNGDELKRELERQNKEREERMEMYLYHQHKSTEDISIGTEDLDYEIVAMNNEKKAIEDRYQEKGINDKEFNTDDKLKLMGRRKYLNNRLKERENTVDALAFKCKVFGNKFEGLKEALQLIERYDINQEKMKRYRETLLKLKEDITIANEVIDNVQSKAYALLPKNVSSHCMNVDSIKKRLVELQDDLLEKRYFAKKKIVFSEKENEALSIAIQSETRISHLLEQRKRHEIERLIYHKLRITELKEIIKHCNEELVLINLTLEEAQALNNNVKGPKLKLDDAKEENIKSNVKKEKVKELKENKKMIVKQIKKFNDTFEELKAEYKALDSSNAQYNETVKLLEKIEKQTAYRRILSEKLQTETVLRKAYYNQVEDLKGAIRVYCRIRPISESEIKRGDEICFDFPDIYSVALKPKFKKVKETREYLFDQVFPMSSTQEEIFQNIEPLLEIVFTGFNVCIFAYGQTGSGKTFTLIGSMDFKPHMGIVPKSFNKIYEMINKNKKFVETECNFFMLELYNEKLLDLMKTDAEYSEKLEIKKNEQGMVIVPGLSTRYANSATDMINYFHSANKNRHIASTKMNSESSRSHLILTIIFKFKEINFNKTTYGKLSIIDLAGSERAAKSGVVGINYTEAKSINQALTALGDVISALTQVNKGFVPYRNNKLTQLMQDSLGGTAKTVMIVNLSPVDYNVQESISSLNYATRVKTITNEIVKVTDFDEINLLKDTLAKLKNGEDVEIP